MSCACPGDERLLFATDSMFDSGAQSHFYHQFCEYLFDGVYFVDRERKIVFWNKGAELLTGYSSNDVLGSHCFDNLLMHVDDSGTPLCHGGCPLDAAIRDGRRHEAEVYLRHKDGYRVPVSVRVVPMKDSSGTTIGAVEAFSDISSQKHMERRVKDLEALAYTDPLTGLSNRRHIAMAGQHAIEELEGFGTRAGLLFIDIDRFKAVNDEFGHDTGDAAIKTVAATLKHALRFHDQLGRWGGDEFLAIVRCADESSLAQASERCRRLVAASLIGDGSKQIRLTVSIGGALLQPGKPLQEAFEKADERLQQAKRSGRDRSRVAMAHLLTISSLPE